MEWEISEPFKKRRLDFDRYPDMKAPGVAQWNKVTAQPNGVMDFSRTYGRLGTEPDGILVSHNEGRLFLVMPDGRVTTLLDTTAQRMNLADFGYAPGRNMVVFPTFIDSRVAAFRLGK